MSVNLMSAIFETEFFDLTDEEGNVTKASTAKLVLLSMADHANDEGEGAYPSIERLCRKTALSPQTIRNTFDALRHSGIISLTGLSKWGTNNHTINTKSFPKAIGKEVMVLTLYPLDPLIDNATPSNQSHVTLYPLDPNHHINNNKPDMLDMLLEQEQKAQPIRTACLAFESALLGSTVSQWPWDSNTKWQKFAKWVAAQDAGAFRDYAEWRKKDGKYQAMSNNKIRQDPQMFMDTGWPTFLAHVSMYANSQEAEFGL